MSTAHSSAAYASSLDDDVYGAPVLVEPEIRRLDGVVREVSVPPFAKPVRHGSLADLPFDNAGAAPDAVVLGRKTADGGWRDVTAAEFAAEVTAVAKGLIAEGLTPGDRIAVMARTIYEWTVLDFAAWAAGLVTVPVYPTSSVFQVRWILQDSGAVALITETAAQAAALGPEFPHLPDLRHVWIVEKDHVERLAEAGAHVPDQEVDVRRGVLGPDTLATLVYTSGTTGRPKGCALTHGNFFAEVDNAVELLYPVFKAQTGEEASVLLFLPLSHVFGRMVAVACVRARVRLGHAPSLKPEDLLPDLASFRPTCLLTIPYMLEKVFNAARAKAEAGGRASTFDRAAAVARRYGEAVEARRTGTGPGPSRSLKAARALYDPLVYRRLRNAMGGRVRYAVCGGSPLGRRLAAFYAGAGIEVFEGYGLTETTGATTVTPGPLEHRLGTGDAGVDRGRVPCWSGAAPRPSSTPAAPCSPTSTAYGPCSRAGRPVPPSSSPGSATPPTGPTVSPERCCPSTAAANSPPRSAPRPRRSSTRTRAATARPPTRRSPSRTPPSTTASPAVRTTRRPGRAGTSPSSRPPTNSTWPASTRPSASGGERTCGPSSPASARC
ncbi:2-succinylbenzoate--CoA ligase [Streptomyces griseomycini]